MPAKGWRTVSIRINLLEALQKVADQEGKNRTDLIHEVLWAYAKLKGGI